MYLIKFNIPAKLIPEITDILINLGALAVDSNEHLLTAYFKSTREIKRLFSAELYVVKKVNTTHWQNKWFKYYQGVVVDQDIYIQAYNKDKPKQNYKYIIKLDPRYAFGDGQHPTTLLCLRALKKYIKQTKNIKLLDAGTGTGVLAILAWLMGVADITAFDLETAAVQQSRKNFRLNGLDKIKLFKADATTVKGLAKYNLIAANLLTGILQKCLCNLKKYLAADGVLIVTGISDCWVSEIKQDFKKHKLSIIQHTKLNGWNCFVLGVMK